jgi:NAD(P)-dependent dehydrogenase (short-subunit alcohol dehydrogenase family)
MKQSGTRGDTRGRVAWVTGASRDVGRGIALALGEAGWTVYVTARSSLAGRTGHLPGTVEECADAITARGGSGVPVVCDHRDDDAVAAVAERIAATHDRLDLLANNAWGGYERLNAGPGANGTPRCGSSRSSCSTRCSQAAFGHTTSRWRDARRC